MSISQDWITNELEDTELEALHRSPLLLAVTID